MSVITLRGLDAQAEKEVRKNAASCGKSINRFLVELIEEQVLGAHAGKPREHHDLDHLIGKMTAEDRQCIEDSLHEQRQIDHELWS